MIEGLQEKLKPCPLCGHDVRVIELSYISNEIVTHIQCPHCELELRHTQYFQEIWSIGFNVTTTLPVNEDATTVWNTRVGEN